MALKDVFKVTRKTFLNPAGWIGYQELKGYNRLLWTILKGVFVPIPAARNETFEQAMRRFNVSDNDLREISSRYRLYTFLFITLGFASICGGFYFLIIHKSVSSLILAFSVTALFFVQAFKYDFWIFQIKHRKLGCSFSDWWNGNISNEETQP